MFKIISSKIALLSSKSPETDAEKQAAFVPPK